MTIVTGVLPILPARATRRRNMSDHVVIQGGTQIDSAGETSEADPRARTEDVKTGLLLDFQGVSRFIRGRVLFMLSTWAAGHQNPYVGRDEPLMVNCLYAYSPCLDIDTGLTSSVSPPSCRTCVKHSGQINK